MARIVALLAREILDSRGVPTIEVDVRLDNGACGRAAAPAGGSRGSREAFDLRDGDRARYEGRGVRQAVANVRCVIAPAIVGMNIADQSVLDRSLVELDGAKTRSRLGANTILAVSVAAAHALAGNDNPYKHLALHDRYQLPVPMFNVLNGGAHADNDVDFEEFMIAPVGAASFSEALRMGVETYRALRSMLKRAGKATSVGDEGGFAPDLDSHTQAPELLLAAIEHAGLRPQADVVIAVDAAAGELFEEGTYVFRKSMRRRRTTDQMIQFYESWLKHYPIWSIEDALAEVDIEGWRALTYDPLKTHAARGRRSLRHQCGAAARRHRRRPRQRSGDQAQSGWYRLRDFGCDYRGPAWWVRHRDQPSRWRDGRRLHR